MENFLFAVIIMLLLGSLLCIALLKVANVSALPAYFLAGLLAGPAGLGILDSGATTSFVAEIGIILLLFTVGLQIDLSGLKSMRRFVFVLGGLQVGVTVIVVAALSQFFVDNFLAALLIGFVAMMSPTAVVSQILIEENSVSSPTGRRALGILLFQDFLTIPLIIVYSSGDIAASLWPAVPILALKITAVLIFIMSLGPKITRPWLNWVVARGDKELFVLNIVILIAAAALASGLLGLSYVLGPFLVGILIAETPHRLRVERMIEPFRHLFMGFFFVAIGMLIDPKVFAGNAGLIALLAPAMWAIKIPVVLFAARAVGTAPATAWRTSLLMGGGGPFGFVLLTVAMESGIISNALFQILVPANIIALAATPFIWSQSDRLVKLLCRDDWKIDARQDAAAESRTAHLSGHVIVCGFGATGQAVAGILRTQKPPFVALENNYEILHSAVDSGEIIYGDARRPRSLSAAGIARAAVVNITFSSPAAAVAAVRAARSLNAEVHIIAKAETARQAEELAAAGADQTLVESHQSGLSFAGQTLRRLGAEADVSAFKRARFRDDPFFRGQYIGTGDADDSPQFVSCKVVVADISLRTLSAEVAVVAWRRDGREMDINMQDGVPAPGDDLILMGEPAQLAKIKTLLLSEDAAA